ncbi:hypothetical protein GCM10009127_11480 [Alteraurantiacibacter aestuarii]|uniref:DUF3617 family protein n=1 Tax=Alteraurantiacibacter aestuarii TaxID=650004 RepID=A0A844ZIA5_9SPHN|nr:DUF6491 family protein [Alteraurantiacibacter aestuarii]MXO87535.1 hypothetical protein [Alteraurantiacibacter aestuarii]
MNKSVASFIALGAIAMSAGCAPVDGETRASGDGSARQCFFTSQINSYSDAEDGPDGEERFYIETGPNDNWLFEAIGPCNDLDFTMQIALDTRGMGSVCTGNTETLLIPRTPTGTGRCSVRVLQKMTDDERDAFEAAAKAAVEARRAQ